MKKIFLLFFMLACVTLASAQETMQERKPVTNKWSLISGKAKVANHYLNTQEYSGNITGLEAIHGRYFRKSNHLSWKLTLAHMRNKHNNELKSGGLVNAASTSHLSIQTYEADYGVFYNWLINNSLQVRTGGSFNVYGSILSGDKNAINNAATINLQTQFYAHAQIRYGWDFEKVGLDIFANIATPFMGFMAADERYEGFAQTIVGSELNVKEYSHFKFSSLHNLQGVNFEMGVDLALRNLTLCLAYEAKNRWWNAYELQNYRKNSLIKLGISVNLLTQQKHKTIDRQF